MWIFCYFRNQLCPCDVVSGSTEERQKWSLNMKATSHFKDKFQSRDVHEIGISARFCKPWYLVEVRCSLPFNCSEFSYCLLLDWHPKVVPILYPGDEELNPHFNLQKETNIAKKRGCNIWQVNTYANSILADAEHVIVILYKEQIQYPLLVFGPNS